ncbi:hypothetical protein ACQCWA_08465 [Rossellomorea aquimaris]|jgi:predicted  nucleic acid-binding Zn-ribbon protein|uniref:hypothetical protein n=1 Tax=Bacillaceae TaxID=186817 RepID=UPI0011F011CD|nr:hypothetical protein [Bacillus sp. CH30_1T]KAA0564562.1 hypothetical protein F0342_10380 [Bacillus sp. CH30_1T]
MPYHKNKQQAYQAAEQSVTEIQNTINELVLDGASYGSQLAHLKNEVNEAYQQIENALEVASDTQRAQLQQFKSDLSSIVSEVNGQS